MALLCNDIFHWLGANLESALCFLPMSCPVLHSEHIWAHYISLSISEPLGQVVPWTLYYIAAVHSGLVSGSCLSVTSLLQTSLVICGQLSVTRPLAGMADLGWLLTYEAWILGELTALKLGGSARWGPGQWRPSLGPEWPQCYSAVKGSTDHIA